MISEKGREEIHKLIASDLVESWAQTDQTLKNVVRMLLTQRPDLLKLYFLPAIWDKISQLERKQSASVILALLKGAVISIADTPPIAAWDQAVFYMGTRIPCYMQMAEQWCEAHPQDCRQRLKAGKLTPLSLPHLPTA